jgi:hypothetical protein
MTKSEAVEELRRKLDNLGQHTSDDCDIFTSIKLLRVINQIFLDSEEMYENIRGMLKQDGYE